MIVTETAQKIYSEYLMEGVAGIAVYYDAAKDVRVIKERDIQEFFIIDSVCKYYISDDNYYLLFVDTETGASFMVNPETEVNVVIPIQRAE
jgi:phosphatidate phosphatase APP1